MERRRRRSRTPGGRGTGHRRRGLIIAAPPVATERRLGPAPGVADLTFEGTRLLVAPRGTVMELDAQASILWDLFDAQVTVDELTDDVVAVYGAPREQVATDLAAMVATLDRAGLLAPHPPPPATPTPDPRHLALPPAPCDCGFRDVQWQPGLAVAVGHRHLGLRTNLTEVHEGLQALLADHLVDDGDVAPNVSVVHRGAGRAGAPVLELWAQQTLACRTASAARVGAQLALELTALSGQPPSAGALWVRATPVGTTHGIVLAPTPHHSSLGFLAGPIARRSWQVGPAVVGLDPATATVVITDEVGLHPDAIEAFGTLSDWAHDGPDLLGPGRYPLRAVTLGLAGDPDPTPSTMLLRHLLPLVVDRHHADLTAVAPDLVALGRQVDVSGPGTEDLLGWLDHTLGAE